MKVLVYGSVVTCSFLGRFIFGLPVCPLIGEILKGYMICLFLSTVNVIVKNLNENVHEINTARAFQTVIDNLSARAF